MPELVFEKRPLVRYFAVLRPTSGGGPSYQFCETECQMCEIDADIPTSEYVSIIKNAQIPLSELQKLKRNEEPILDTEPKIYEYRMRNASQPNSDIRRVRYWHLPHSFFWNEYTIPVLEFTKRFILTREFSRILPPNVTSSALQETAMNYERIRQRQVLKLSVSEGSLVTSQEIPSFVIDLLYKDQLSKNGACSITMNPFKEIQILGVTPCYHLFEFIALNRWISEHHKCPLCRKPTLQCQRYDANATLEN